MSSIRVEGLTKHFDSVVAVDDVTLHIEPGAFVTLLGPSGSGKTTTMRMIAGLEAPTRGNVYIKDRMVSGPGVFVPTHRRRLGMVFQSYAVWPHRTVFQNVAFPLQQIGVPRAEQDMRVKKMLNHVGLGEYGARYPSQLSGGQQQRVALARALVGEPDVILFDEPLSNLDAQLRDSMRLLLQQIHKDFEITAVYVTHDQIEAMVLSDEVHVMQEGRLVQSGSPEELYERPNSLFVAEFIGNANRIDVAEVDRSAKRVRLAGNEALDVAIMPDTIAENMLIVRPHRIRFATDRQTKNVLKGQIAAITYLGDRMRYLVQTEAGTEIALESPSEGRRREQGEAIKIHLPPEYCIVI